jgi:hypothetical protein
LGGSWGEEKRISEREQLFVLGNIERLDGSVEVNEQFELKSVNCR